MLVQGKLVKLSLVEGKYGVGMVRVSQQRQRRGKNANPDGFSETDQARRIIRHYVALGQAFRIFSDCGLSGSLPPNDPHLIKKMWAKKAAVYSSVFDNVFLSDDTNTKFTAAQQLDMQAYKKKHIQKILSGKTDIDDVASNVTNAEGIPIVVRGRHKVRLEYRPGLTLLMQALDQTHTLAITDVSRLCRSQVLTAELGDLFIQHKVKVVGLVEAISFFNTDDFSAQVLKTILAMLAEQKLQELCTASLRGVYAMLESGRAHGILPHWLQKEEDGKCVLVPEAARQCRKIVDMLLANPNISVHEIAHMVREEGVTRPNGSLYTAKNIGDMLKNPTLMGVQKLFGITWQNYPAVVTAEEFERIGVIIQGRRHIQFKNSNPKDEQGYLLTSLVKCHCLRAMPHAVSGRYKHLYRCITLKRRGTGEHACVSMESLDAFVNELMSAHPIVVLGTLKNDARYKEAEAEIITLEEELVHARARQKMAATEAKERAIIQMTASGIDASNPVFTQAVETMAKAFMATDQGLVESQAVSSPSCG